MGRAKWHSKPHFKRKRPRTGGKRRKRTTSLSVCDAYAPIYTAAGAYGWKPPIGRMPARAQIGDDSRTSTRIKAGDIGGGPLRALRYHDVKSTDITWLDVQTLDECVVVTDEPWAVPYATASSLTTWVLLLRFTTVLAMSRYMKSYPWLQTLFGGVLEPEIEAYIARGKHTVRIRPRPRGCIVLVELASMGTRTVSGEVSKWMFLASRRIGVVVLTNIREDGPLDAPALAGRVTSR
jgi:hypothetical protein